MSRYITHLLETNPQDVPKDNQLGHRIWRREGVKAGVSARKFGDELAKMDTSNPATHTDTRYLLRNTMSALAFKRGAHRGAMDNTTGPTRDKHEKLFHRTTHMIKRLKNTDLWQKHFADEDPLDPVGSHRSSEENTPSKKSSDITSVERPSKTVSESAPGYRGLMSLIRSSSGNLKDKTAPHASQMGDLRQRRSSHDAASKLTTGTRRTRHEKIRDALAAVMDKRAATHHNDVVKKGQLKLL